MFPRSSSLQSVSTQSLDDRQTTLGKSLYELLHSENIYIKYVQQLDCDTITTLIHYHKRFLKRLKKTLKPANISVKSDRVHSCHFNYNSLHCHDVDHVDVSATFSELTPVFALYTEYIHQDYPILQKQVSSQIAIMPIQRIMRYALLLKTIAKHSLPVYQENLTLLVEQWNQMVSDINTSVKDQEQLQQLVHFQENTSFLPEPLMSPGQSLLLVVSIYRISHITMDKRILLILRDKVVWLKQVAPNAYAFRGRLYYSIKVDILPEKDHYIPVQMTCPVDHVQTLHHIEGSLVKYTFYVDNPRIADEIKSAIDIGNTGHLLVE